MVNIAYFSHFIITVHAKVSLFKDILMKNSLNLSLSVLVGLICSTNVFAQDEEKKKPSWSTGLPERQVTPSLNAPAAEVEKPQFEIQQPTLIDIPEAGVTLPEGLNEKFEMPAVIIDNSLGVTEEIQQEEQQNDYADYSAADSSLLDNYQWETIEMEPVIIPKVLYFTYKEVLLEITINPEGRVIKVNRVSDRTSLGVLTYASNVIKKWRFKAPAEIGIDGNITKTMLVKLEPR